MSGDFFMEMYLISVVLLLLLSNGYGDRFLSIRSIVFGKLIAPSNQLSNASGLQESPKAAPVNNFPARTNASIAQILQEKTYLDVKEKRERFVRNSRNHKPYLPGRKALKKHRTHNRRSRTRAKKKHRWKGSSKKLRNHSKADDDAVGSKSRGSSVLQKLQDKYEEMGSDDSMVQDIDESHGRESRKDAQLLFLAILIILSGSFFLVFICAKFYPGCARRLIPFKRYNGYEKLAGEDDIENEKSAMQSKDLGSSYAEQDKTSQFEQPKEAQGGSDPSKSNDETLRLPEQQPSNSKGDNKNVANPSAFTDANESPKKAIGSSAFSRMLPIYMGKYGGFQVEDEESSPAHHLHSSSESEISDLSTDNWSWPTRLAKAVLRSISNMLPTKKISESQKLRDDPSKDALIEMDALSMENLARDSISLPFQVQNPIESIEYDRCMKYRDERDYARLNVPYDMTHEVKAKEGCCNLEPSQEFYWTMETKSSLDQQREEGHASDVEDWCQKKPKGKRRKQNIREEISKRQKCNDEKEFIYVIHDASYESSESESNSKESMSAEYKSSRHLADREKKSFAPKNVKMCDGKSEIRWKDTKIATNGTGERFSWKNGANSDRKAPIDNPLRSDRKFIAIRDLQRQGDNSNAIKVPVVKHTEQSLHNIYCNKPVRKVFMREKRNRKHDSYVKRGHRSRSYTLVQTQQHAARMNRCHSLSSILCPNSKISHSTYVEQDFHLNKEDNDEIQFGSRTYSQLPAPLFGPVRVKTQCSASNANAQNDELSITCAHEQRHPSIQHFKRNMGQTTAFQKQQTITKKRLPLSDNPSIRYHDITPVEAESDFQLQTTLSGSSLWRISPENSATGENIVMLNRAAGSSSSLLYCDSEELVVARETRGDPGNHTYLKGAQKDYEHGENDDYYYEYDSWLQSRGSDALQSRLESDRMVSNRHDSGIGSLSRSTDRASAILSKIHNGSNKSLKYKGENASAIHFSGKLCSVSNKSIQTVQPRSKSRKRWTFVRKLFRSKTSGSEVCTEEKPVVKKNKGKCKKMQKKLTKPKIQKKLKVK